MTTFDWDLRKARLNVSKHGISFEQAATAFDDPFALIELDVQHSTKAEKRERLIGCSDAGLIIVIFTKRPPFTRLISARKAGRLERALYEANQR